MVLEEADESVFWLELMIEGGTMTEAKVVPLAFGGKTANCDFRRNQNYSAVERCKKSSI